MKIRRPSPAMVVASIALFISLGGTGIAAIDFARNAGAVDGKSAVAASTSVAHAAGKLVATNKSGTDKGKIPSRFIAGTTRATPFVSYIPVTDNQTGAPVTLATITGIGTLTTTCADQNANAGVEDPISTLTLDNTAAFAINTAKRVGSNPWTILGQLPATIQTVTISGSNSFDFHLQVPGADIQVSGIVRQDGRATADAKCLVHGTVLRASS